MMTTLSRRSFVKITAIAGAVLTAPMLADVLFRQTVKVAETRTLMGTVVHLAVITSDEDQGRQALDATFGEMERLIGMFDHRQRSSPLAELNRYGKLEQAPSELIHLMTIALNYSMLSGGAFDVTIKPVLDAYQAGQTPGVAERALVDYRRVRLYGTQISFDVPGMAVTLDGIAKGRVVDGGIAALRAMGFENVLVEAGGDLSTSGQGMQNQPWRIGVAHPRPDRMAGYIAKFSLCNRAVATSGDYMNCFTPDMRLHHIIDPHTGISSPALASVSVVASSATAADALSTALMAMQPTTALSLVKRLPGVEALVVSKDLTVQRTAGFPVT